MATTQEHHLRKLEQLGLLGILVAHDLKGKPQPFHLGFGEVAVHLFGPQGLLLAVEGILIEGHSLTQKGVHYDAVRGQDIGVLSDDDAGRLRVEMLAF